MVCWSLQRNRHAAVLLTALLTLFCFSISAQQIPDSSRHIDTDSLVKLLRQATNKDRAVSIQKYQEGKMALRQEALTQDFKTTLLHAKTFLNRAPDTNAINAELSRLEHWFQIGRDGIFENKGSAQSHRNLTTSGILLNELLRKTEGRKLSIDKYEHELNNFRLRLDSLNSDSLLYYFSSDSATLMQYLATLIMLSKQVGPADSNLTQALFHARALQARTNLLQSRISASLEEINTYHRELSDHTLNREFSNLWGEIKSSRPIGEILKFSREKNQLAFWFYAQNHWGRLVLLGLLLIAATFFLNSLKKKLAEENSAPENHHGRLALRYPFLSALTIVFSIFQFMFPDPPFIFCCIFWVPAAISLTIIFRGFITRYWMIVWLMMFAQFLFASFDNLILQASRIERYYIFTFSLLGVIYGLMVLLRGRRSELREKHILWFIAFVVVLEFAATLFNLSGRYNYAKTLYVSGFVNVIIAITFLWVVRLVNETLMLASEIYKRPEKKSFYINFERVGKQAPGIFYIFLVTGWFIIFGRNFYAFKLIADPIQDFLFTERTIGQYSFSIKGIVLFFGILFIAAIVSRVVSYFASDKIPVHSSSADQRRIGLGSWILLVRIAIISMGLFLAVAAAGMPLDRITIILGALGVGVGLGLQALVSNLVSGLILAFEKPVNVGDLIEVAGKTGTIRSIGFRSSVVTSIDGSSVIIPNGDLLNGNLVNWSQGMGLRRIDLLVGVAYGTDVNALLPQINELLQANKRVLSTPTPVAFAEAFNDSSIDLKLIFWTPHPREYLSIKSEVIGQVLALFDQKGIVIPFPQRDLHIYNHPDNKQDKGSPSGG
ncbi:mechanosensitive ion channel-like protein [Pseudobacter ginsenosidimutans]|uniref:Mechanosensitive ion channel-like protein n=2 Tax=Pseudobacter ginsenosidimutans TaxID=661488 RepID=A0A4V2F219_9BACT|nr:mechanosensitive ion channel-like protein [Pseudobacter ginsenosidimutans]